MKTWMKNNKGFLAAILAVAVISPVGAYYTEKAFEEDTPKTQVARTGDLQAEKQRVKQFSKGFIVASTRQDWDSLLAMSSGAYHKQLEESIIPKAKKAKSKPLPFRPQATSAEVVTMENGSAVVKTSYILTVKDKKKDYSVQEGLLLFLSKEEGKWTVVDIQTNTKG